MEGTRGVYCVDINIKARPLSYRSRLPKIDRTMKRVPMALDDNLIPLNKRFIKRVIKDKDIHNYSVDYSISNKKYLSALCYNI